MLGGLLHAGVDLGITALHPVTGAAIPVFAADYVISEYGTRALMGVPAHDRRDRVFADHYGLPSVTVNNSSESEDTPILLNSQQVCTCNGTSSPLGNEILAFIKGLAVL